MPIRITKSLCPAAVIAVAFASTLSLTSGTVMAKSAIQQECSAKYQAAKAANTLNGQTYNQFYKQCAAEAKAAPATATPAAAPATPAVAPSSAPASAAPVKTVAPPAPAPTAPAAAGTPVFPKAISAAYASESPGVARRKTCDDQYKANKATGGNAGLKWIEKGGGYYSECNKALKQ
ncbi:MAG: hypothetical protein P4L76_16310 [Beijerinckiaceae bacterium]|nr:hypothetical protein [Beijerinckiaceae bacterium]